MAHRACMAGHAQVPAELYAAGVSRLALAAYGILDIHQGRNGVTWPSRKHLADHLRCSLRSLDRAIDELEQTGWVIVQRGGQRNAEGTRTTNRYVLLRRARKVVHRGDKTAPPNHRQ